MIKRVIFCVFLCLLVPATQAALTYDTKLRIPATALSTTTAAASAAYTCGANAKVLVVMVLYAGTTQRSGGAPTYNSVGLTQISTKQGVTEASCEMWYMLSPPANQSLTVAVPNGNGVTMWVYVASGNAGTEGVCVVDSSGTRATTADDPNVPITTVREGCLIFAVVADGDGTLAPTARTGTSLYEEDIAAYGGAAQYYVMAGTGLQSMSWTEATSDDYGAIAVAFKEVSTFVRTVNNPVGITDARTVSIGTVKTIANSVGVTDAMTVSVGVVRTIANSIGTTDARTISKGDVRTFNNNLGITDTRTFGQSAVRTLNESVDITDTFHRSYVIHDIYELQAMEDDLTGYYILANDIDATPANPNSGNWDEGEWPGTTGFRPIETFTGYFDGENHKIIGLYINRPSGEIPYWAVALFIETISSVIIRNVGLEEVDITGYEETGGLVGYQLGEIDNCYVTGTVTATYGNVGGLVAEKIGIISNSYFNGTVSGERNVGGLVGYGLGLSISKSYSKGNVNGNGTRVGGLIGSVSGSPNAVLTSECYSSSVVTNAGDQTGGLVGYHQLGSSIINCYAMGNVISESYGIVGGLVGENLGTISKCYSVGTANGDYNVGGFCGENSGTITDSFWDTQTSGQAASDGGTGKTTAEMKNDATFTDLDTVGLDASWDFVGNPHDDVANEDIWNIDGVTNNGYPFLSWQPVTPPTAGGQMIIVEMD